MFNTTCNTTLEDLRISPGSEVLIVGPLNFHDLARIIGASCTLIATVMSMYLIWMHALNYTRPREQRYIIRILFMVPIYAISSFFQIQWYWHAIYFQVISDCYEAFAIASFFALMCHYVAPDLHNQKAYFREMTPVKAWVLPINWFAKCCGGQRGPWRTPKSGLTWFNIIWIGVYHYCFIRVAMTVSAVLSQKFDRYCESSNSPVFGHIWIIVLNAAAVTVAMFCLIQFYVQLRDPLAEYKPLLKVIAIKLVIFLSFWQNSAISVGTSTLKIVHPNKVLAYPDLKVGIPALLLCVEMAIFAVLHLWAFPYAPYRPGAPTAFFPVSDAAKGARPQENERAAPAGGFMGFGAMLDALNIWDFVKAFGRGMRWLFCGVKRRKEDVSYKLSPGDSVDLGRLPEGKDAPSSYEAMRPGAAPHGEGYDTRMQSPYGNAPGHNGVTTGVIDESAGLMEHAQPNPTHGSRRSPDASPPPRPRREPVPYESPYYSQPGYDQPPNYPAGSYHPSIDQSQPVGPPGQAISYDYPPGQSAQDRRTSTQARVGEALWGPQK